VSQNATKKTAGATPPKQFVEHQIGARKKCLANRKRERTGRQSILRNFPSRRYEQMSDAFEKGRGEKGRLKTGWSMNGGTNWFRRKKKSQKAKPPSRG